MEIKEIKKIHERGNVLVVVQDMREVDVIRGVFKDVKALATFRKEEMTQSDIAQSRVEYHELQSSRESRGVGTVRGP